MKKYFRFIFYLIFIIFSLFSKANGEKINFEKFKFIDINGKEFRLNNIYSSLILIVNTASFCGFTKQYSHLQDLRNKYALNELFIMAIPSNDFGGQEPGKDSEIKDFCEINYGITFPIITSLPIGIDNLKNLHIFKCYNNKIENIPKHIIYYLESIKILHK